MDTKAVDLPALPDGFFAVKKGGRPKKEARDAAIFLAKLWRMEKHGATSSAAAEWIVEQWQYKGIGETANVYHAIKRARDRGLNQSCLMITEPAGLCTAVEGEQNDSGATWQDGARSWHWIEGMTEAIEGRASKPMFTVHREVLRMSPVAAAARALMK